MLTLYVSLCIVLFAFTTGTAEIQTTLNPPVNPPAQSAVAAPSHLVERTGDRSVILHWHPVSAPNLVSYRVYRAVSTPTRFELHSPRLTTTHFVDFDVNNGSTYYYRVHAIDSAGQASSASAIVRAKPHALDDQAFLDLIQQTAFDYFWYEANEETGLIKDRSIDTAPCNIAAVGFGLSALTIAIDRAWISRETARRRVRTTLNFLLKSPQGPENDASGYKGFFYRFLDMQTGRRVWNAELSSIDTALLLSGVLHVQQYFSQGHAEEVEIRALANALYRRVEWPWMQIRPPKIGHGWRPDTGFLSYDWSGYSEAMILYLLALGSPTHPVNDAAWEAWTSTYTWQTHYGYTFVAFPPLFGHQYPHVWIDFHGIQDAYMREKGIDYFENSRRATLANRAYAIANPQGWSDYDENVWGFTASDIPMDYSARGAPPALNDDGTVAPTAAGGSMVFTPNKSLAALRHMYETYRTQLWGPYGFKDAFNPSESWFATDYLGIDQGPIMLMIENMRSRRIWKLFMQVPPIQLGLQRAGFVASAEEDQPPTASAERIGAAMDQKQKATKELALPTP